MVLIVGGMAQGKLDFARRELGVTALGDTLEQAIGRAYAAAKPIAFTDMHFRRDIGRAF